MPKFQNLDKIEVYVKPGFSPGHWSSFYQIFSIKTSGLIINPCWPYIGASPNDIVKCPSYAESSLDIKCLHSHRNSYVQAFTDNDSYIYKEDLEYYYQIQWNTITGFQIGKMSFFMGYERLLLNESKDKQNTVYKMKLC